MSIFKLTSIWAVGAIILLTAPPSASEEINDQANQQQTQQETNDKTDPSVRGETDQYEDSTEPQDIMPVYQPPFRGAPVGRIAGGTRGTDDPLPFLCLLVPEHVGLSIDTPSDLEKAKAYLRGLRRHTPTV